MLLANNDKYGLGCRLTIWKLNWKQITLSPFIGRGESVKYLCAADNLLVHAHSLYIQSLVSNGIIGFLAILTFLGIGFVTTLKLKNKQAFAAGMFALLVAGFAEHWLVSFTLVKAFVLFLSYALQSNSSSTKEKTVMLITSA
jgi:O-antigen ligase